MSLDNIRNPVLYATVTLVAYNINMKYYGGLHYMWCTPYFGSDYESPHFTVPPSSSPLEIYNTLKKEIDGNDAHETKIKLNRQGIRKGAEFMKSAGRITDEAYDDIIAISKKSPSSQFRPLLCVIPRTEAVPYQRKVEIKNRANPLSYEYILADVPQSIFDIIRIG